MNRIVTSLVKFREGGCTRRSKDRSCSPPLRAQPHLWNPAFLYRGIRQPAYLQSFPHGKGKIRDSSKRQIWEEAGVPAQREGLDVRLPGGTFGGGYGLPPCP